MPTYKEKKSWRPNKMSEIYRVPPWLMLECWDLSHDPDDKPNTFTVSIYGGDTKNEYQGKGVSISHAAKNAYKKRQRALKEQTNETSIPAEGSALPSENQTQENESPETGTVG